MYCVILAENQLVLFFLAGTHCGFSSVPTDAPDHVIQTLFLLSPGNDQDDDLSSKLAPYSSLQLTLSAGVYGPWSLFVELFVSRKPFPRG